MYEVKCAVVIVDADNYADMTDNLSAAAASAEKHKIAGPWGTDGSTDIVKALCPQPPKIPAHAAMVHHPRHKAGAIKGRGRGAAAPYIGIAEIFLRFGNHGGELFILQRLRGYLIAGHGAVVPADVSGAGEQIGPVAQRRHVEGIAGELLLAHDIDGDVGQVKVFQRHGADVIVIGDLHRVSAAVLRRPGFCPITHLHRHGLGEDILAVKEGLQIGLYIGQRPALRMERGKDRQQHIGIVLYAVQIKMILVVVVGGLVAVEVGLQIGLKPRIGGLGPQQVSVLRRIGGRRHAPGHTVAEGYQRGHTGLHPHQQEQAEQGDQHPHRMPLDKAHHGPASFLRRDCCFLRRPCALLGRLPRLFLIPFALLPFPPHPGQSIFAQIRVLGGGLLEAKIRRSFHIPALRLFHLPGGFSAGFW